MRHKFLLILFLILVVALCKVERVRDIFFPIEQQVINSIPTHSTIQLDPYATTLGGKLISPLYDHEQVDGAVIVSGSVRKFSDHPASYVWIHINYLGKKIADLPNFFDYYVPVANGTFQQKVHLFCGRGKYSITVRVAGEEKKNTYYPFASFQVINVNPLLSRDISYSSVAKEIGLQLNYPKKGYQVESNRVRLSGEFTKRYSGKNLLVQVRKGKKVWRKVFLCSAVSFQETVPLLFGNGVHEIQLMLPDSKRPGYYLEGATLFIHNESHQTWNPIQYTNLYKERGIELSTPIAGGSHQKLTYRIAGSINSKLKSARDTDHLVVRTTKGKDEATYFIPVTNYRFDRNIYFRFGSGTYTVDLLVSENTKKRRDYFRFFTAAQFKVAVHGIQDARYLLPSRGIDSNDMRIIRLANKLTQDHVTDRKKAEAIYTFVAKNITYDVQKLKLNTFLWNDNSLKALQMKTGVCQDYVFLTLALLRAAGIPSRFVEGAVGSQAHAWVESKLENGWITMDPTWGSGYIQGDRFVKRFDKNFFNPSEKKFSETHRRIGIIY